MRVDLGMNVHASDSDNVGSVDRIIVDANTKGISKLVVRSGFLTHHDKVVDIDMVTGQDADGLRLDLTSDQVAELPDFVDTHYTVISDNDARELPFAMPNAGGGGMYLYGTPAIGRGYEGTQDSIFNAAPSAAPDIAPQGTASETDVVISSGTDVIGANGDKIGTVGEVFVDDGGKINGFTVSGGWFKDNVRVPIDWVAETGSKQITLTVDGEEAATRAYDVEEQTL